VTVLYGFGKEPRLQAASTAASEATAAVREIGMTRQSARLAGAVQYRFERSPAWAI